MKVLVISDTHGWEHEVQTVVDRHQHEVEAMFHCGDSELSNVADPLKGIKTVKGNCDLGTDFPEEIIEHVNGMTFFISHGHLLKVKITNSHLVDKAVEVGAHVICHGHTHIPFAIQENGLIIMNPGSLRLPREYSIGTYAILETSEENIIVNYYSLEGRKVEELNKKFCKKY